MENILSEIYYNASNPGSFGGIKSLYLEAKNKIPNLRIKDVKDWLSGEIVYTLHKQSRRRFKRNPIVAESPFENFQADLIDMKEHSNTNNGYNYILTIIDVFSKKAWAGLLKNKSAKSIINCFKQSLDNNFPFKLQTDNGKEFVNLEFKKLMSSLNINHFTTKNSEIKCAIVERFNRTLKNKMFKYFTKTGKRNYIDVIEDIINSYNNSYHRSIKMTPNEVNLNNKEYVFKNLYGFNNKREMLRKFKKPNLLVGDTVRQKYILKPLERGYYPNWTDEIFKINSTIKGLNKPVYKLNDNKNRVIDKKFYINEIQKIKPNNIFRVEKIIKEKFVKKKKFYFVKWLNHTESDNSWIPAKDLFNIQNGK